MRPRRPPTGTARDGGACNRSAQRGAGWFGIDGGMPHHGGGWVVGQRQASVGMLDLEMDVDLHRCRDDPDCSIAGMAVSSPSNAWRSASSSMVSPRPGPETAHGLRAAIAQSAIARPCRAMSMVSSWPSRCTGVKVQAGRRPSARRNSLPFHVGSSKDSPARGRAIARSPPVRAVRAPRVRPSTTTRIIRTDRGSVWSTARQRAAGFTPETVGACHGLILPRPIRRAGGRIRPSCRP